MTSILDTRTLVFVLTVMVSVQALVLIALWRMWADYLPVRYWGQGSLIGAAGLFLAALRNLIPDWASILLAGPLLELGWLYFSAGIVSAAERRPPWRAGLVLLGVSVLVNSWFVLVMPSFAARVVIFNVVVLVTSCYTIMVCLKFRGGNRRITLRIIAGAVGILLLANVFRTAAVFSRQLGDLLALDSTQSAFFMAYILFFALVTALLVLLAAQKLQEEVKELARHDVLTGAYNRRALDEFSAKELARSRRNGTPLSFLMLDIDHFKQLNDRYGHRIGDVVLVTVSETAEGTLRPTDVWCRYGGEEFVAMLPDTSGEQAKRLAERLRQEIESRVVTIDAVHVTCTVSIGVAEWRLTDETPDLSIDAADKALYRAKQAGRNCVMIEDEGKADVSSVLQASSAF